jgi:hypothetical protein
LSKNYELYSWQRTDQWLYVLLPAGEPKTWTDLTSAHQYGDREDLKAALAKLPKGTHVQWLRKAEGSPPGRLNLPFEPDQKKLADFCQEHEITLQLPG